MRLRTRWLAVELALDWSTLLLGLEWNRAKEWLSVCPLPFVTVTLKRAQPRCEYCRGPSHREGELSYEPWVHYRCQPHMRRASR